MNVHAQTCFRPILSILQLILYSGFGACGSDDFAYVSLKKVPPTSLDVPSFEDVTLTCSASGIPSPSLSWYQDGLEVSSYSASGPMLGEVMSSPMLGEVMSRLVVPCVQDTSRFVCKATVGNDEAVASTQVNVVEPAIYKRKGQRVCSQRRGRKPSIATWMTTAIIDQGMTARLPCRPQFYDVESRIMWQDNKGNVVVNNGRINVDNNGDLVIEDVSWMDMGEFTCILSNGVGQDQVNTFLYPMALEY